MTTNRMKVALRGAVVAAALVICGALPVTPRSLASHYDPLAHVPAEFLHHLPVSVSMDQVVAGLAR